MLAVATEGRAERYLSLPYSPEHFRNIPGDYRDYLARDTRELSVDVLSHYLNHEIQKASLELDKIASREPVESDAVKLSVQALRVHLEAIANIANRSFDLTEPV